MSEIDIFGWTVQGNKPNDNAATTEQDVLDYSAGPPVDPWGGWTAQHSYQEPVVDEVALALDAEQE